MPKTEQTDEPTFQIGWSGNIWNDLSFTHIDVDPSRAEADQNRWNNQARATLRMTPTLNIDNGWFVQGNAEVVVQGDMIASNASGGVLATTDDLWIRVGKVASSTQLGRFQVLGDCQSLRHGARLGHPRAPRRLGARYVDPQAHRMATDWTTSGIGRTICSAAMLSTFTWTKWLRGELLGHIGAGNGAVPSPNQFDLRPSAIVDIGWLKLKAGYEFGRATPQDVTTLGEDQKNGWAAAPRWSSLLMSNLAVASRADIRTSWTRAIRRTWAPATPCRGSAAS